jgi:regulator of sigma E protease
LLLKLSEGQAISDYGIELQLAYPIYKPKVYRESDLARFDLEKGDVIFAINDLPLVDKKHFESYLLEPNLNSLTVWRDGNGLKLDLARGDSKLLIADVVPDLPAAMVGIGPGDTLVSINGKVFAEASLATKFLREASLPIVLKIIDSDGKANNLTINKRSEDGLVGLYLTELTQVNAIADQLLFEPYLVSIVPESESLWRRVLLAPVRSLTEAYEVFKSSSVGFLSVLGRIVSFRELPETVGGPVAVTQVTSQFLQTDLAGTIWLMAILSLSLAAVNILPLPALDGGRIFFIILEVLRSGKAVPAKFEAITHLLGFLLLMLLIVLITFKDLARIF